MKAPKSMNSMDDPFARGYISHKNKDVVSDVISNIASHPEWMNQEPRRTIIAEGAAGPETLFLDDKLHVLRVASHVSPPFSPILDYVKFNHKFMFAPYQGVRIPRMWKSFLHDFQDGFEKQKKEVLRRANNERKLEVVAQSEYHGMPYFLDAGLYVFSVADDVHNPLSPVNNPGFFDNISYYKEVLPSLDAASLYKSFLGNFFAGSENLEARLRFAVIPQYESLQPLTNRHINGRVLQALEEVSYGTAINLFDGSSPTFVASLEFEGKQYALADDGMILQRINHGDDLFSMARLNVAANEGYDYYMPFDLAQSLPLYQSFAHMLPRNNPLHGEIMGKRIPFLESMKRLHDRERKVPTEIEETGERYLIA